MRGDSVRGELPPVGENSLADAIRSGIGASDTDVVEFVTPQFVRPSTEPIPSQPSHDPNWWKALRKMGFYALKEMGMGVWSVKNGKALMLIPGEWYRFIPNGFKIVGICAFSRGVGEPEAFVKNKTDNDIRFGCLAFGIIVDCALPDDE